MLGEPMWSYDFGGSLVRSGCRVEVVRHLKVGRASNHNSSRCFGVSCLQKPDLQQKAAFGLAGD